MLSGTDMEEKFNELKLRLKEYNPSVDLRSIDKAWEFCKIAHTGQNRLTGDPYASHPLFSALILSEWKVDTDSIVAAFLHDTIEDGGAKREDIVKDFGEDVAALVDGVTKVSDIRLKQEKKDETLENLRKLLLVMAKDLRVVLVKLADRLHNMRTLYALPEDKQKLIARETLEIYAPLAERLGIGEVKGQLEDLAFRYVYPQEYEKILKDSETYYEKSEEVIKKMKKQLGRILKKNNVQAKIHARKKHYYSLWKKLERKEIQWDFTQIHDIVALRIITKDVSDCYLALGIVHKLYKPIPHLGVSDFIAQPKPNGYQSIHTKVFGPEGKPVEVQIRTQKMHEQADYGFAAHWAYSEAKKSGVKDEKLEKGVISDKKKIEWARELIRWQEQITDKDEFKKAVKFDALAHRIYVFTPKGDVYDLPADATPIDFAFAVHTDLGRYIKGAKVDGKIVALDHKLKSGDIVQILKNKKAKPTNRDWLGFVVTHSAKRGIWKYLNDKKNNY
ncbi:bifunctional (p)ppGpp synthetase/guanosine-3',5'-bis(diphosphate) 3'-pyrophosphohydrolase [Candidatus Woesebacteria bacterium]|nr:bifunctional (p)ppGpp synthetase/guanosine-3',5'-bis(diphosphate) 3'-pyrophosphohydrolase [Candidatus Woesebacteria bacterium]